MARAVKANTEPLQRAPRRMLRQVAAAALAVPAVASLLYGAWLALAMYLAGGLSGTSILHYFVCAVLAAALYNIAVRVEPLPPRRKPRGKRWMNVATPTARQIWETAPGDFIESIFAAIGMMAMPTVALIVVLVPKDSLTDSAHSADFAAHLVAIGVAAGAFSLEGAFVSWRGRSMFDPPGQVRRAAMPGLTDSSTADCDDNA